MACCCLAVAFYVVVPLLVTLYFASTLCRFYIRSFLYGLTIILSTIPSAFYSLYNGNTTENHFVVFWFFHLFTRWLNITYKIENAELLESDEPYVLIANHQSAIDVLTMSKIWPKNCVVMLKKSLKYVPFFNICAIKCDSIFIDRFNKNKAHQSVDDARHGIERGKKIFIYPEGTRNNKEDLLPFKKGAFIISKNVNVPIVPVVFSSYKPFYDYDTKKMVIIWRSYYQSPSQNLP